MLRSVLSKQEKSVDKLPLPGVGKDGFERGTTWAATGRFLETGKLRGRESRCWNQRASIGPANQPTARSARKYCAARYQFRKNLWITDPEADSETAPPRCQSPRPAPGPHPFRNARGCAFTQAPSAGWGDGHGWGQRPPTAPGLLFNGPSLPSKAAPRARCRVFPQFLSGGNPPHPALKSPPPFLKPRADRGFACIWIQDFAYQLSKPPTSPVHAAQCAINSGRICG